MCSFSFSAKIAFPEVQHMLLQWAMFKKLNAKQKSLLVKCHSQTLWYKCGDAKWKRIGSLVLTPQMLQRTAILVDIE